MVLHAHFWVKFPDYALDGIYEPNFTSYGRSGSKKNVTNDPVPIHYKIFQSEDRRRIYIYMINGTGTGKYEVTWIIRNSEYYTRVVDYVLE